MKARYFMTPTFAELSAFVGLHRTAGSQCDLKGKHGRIVELRPDRLHPSNALLAKIGPGNRPAVSRLSAPRLRPTGGNNPVERRFELTPRYSVLFHSLKRVRPLDLQQFGKGAA